MSDNAVRAFLVFAPMTRGGHVAHVHRVGCADTRKALYQHEERHIIETDEGPVDAAFAIVDPELGYQPEDFKIFPCCYPNSEGN